VTVSMILVIIALLCAALSFVPRLGPLHQVATILLAVALLISGLKV
jgi:hypothetical protein